MRRSFLQLARPNLGPVRQRLSRRAFLGGSAGVALAGALGGRAAGGSVTLPPIINTVTNAVSNEIKPTALQRQALDALGRETLRQPGTVPNPALPIGMDTMPGIEHVVVLMLENHSFDNILGTLGRGDGFTLGSDGLPNATNPYGNGQLQKAFRMPTTCQLPHQPSQEWRTSYMAYNGGAMNGFVSSPISPSIPGDVGGVAMGYWTSQDLPFTYGMASVFPVADRWFGSMLGQTDPNRRYLVGATSQGQTDDISLSTSDSVGTLVQTALLATPAVTIFDLLTAFEISWTDYYATFPLGATPELDPVLDTALIQDMKPQGQFFVDCAVGALPSFCFIEPDFSTQSQENPQNIAVGEAFAAQVVNAIGSSPDWATTMLIFTYDEHGGYYDHVVPPVALAPDLIEPIVQPGESIYEGFARFGIRVPGVVVSPYAKTNYVSSVVYDHTSILAFVERKWNLPALTLRDANANDLTDMLDMDALADGSPTFPTLPTMPAAGNTAAALACSVTGPGVIPPPDSIIPG